MPSWFSDTFSFFKGKKSENSFDYLDWDKIISDTSESNRKRREAFYYIYEMYQDIKDGLNADNNNDKIKEIENSFKILKNNDNAIYKLLIVKKEETNLESICRKFEFNLAKKVNDSKSRQNFIFFIIFIKQLILILSSINNMIESLKQPIDIDEYKDSNENSIKIMKNLSDNIDKIHNKLRTNSSCNMLLNTFTGEEYNKLVKPILDMLNKQKAYEKLINVIKTKVENRSFNDPSKKLNLSQSVRDLTRINPSEKQKVQESHNIHTSLKRNYEQYDFYCRSYDDICDKIRDKPDIIVKVLRKLERNPRMSQIEFKEYMNKEIVSSDQQLLQLNDMILDKIYDNYMNNNLLKSSKTIRYWYEDLPTTKDKNDIKTGLIKMIDEYINIKSKKPDTSVLDDMIVSLMVKKYKPATKRDKPVTERDIKTVIIPIHVKAILKDIEKIKPIYKTYLRDSGRYATVMKNTIDYISKNKSITEEELSTKIKNNLDNILKPKTSSKKTKSVNSSRSSQPNERGIPDPLLRSTMPTRNNN